MPDTQSIAIDGPVASGKTAVGGLVARRLGYRILDTGAMYRAVTYLALKRGVDLEDHGRLAELASGVHLRLLAGEGGDRLFADGEDLTGRLRDPEVDRGVSLVARVSGVRSALVSQQRAIAREGPIVMVGRDIGTVVLPDAGLKVFLQASVEVRARRRHSELTDAGAAPDYRQVKEDLARRDKIDSERADSPLRPAGDARHMETDRMGVEEVAEKIVKMVKGC